MVDSQVLQENIDRSQDDKSVFKFVLRGISARLSCKMEP